MANTELHENHILIGLGGTGGKILKSFKMRMFEEYNKDERAKIPVAFLYVDSTRKDLMPEKPGQLRDDFRIIGGDNATFTENEFLGLRGNDVTNPINLKEYLDNISYHPEIQEIVANIDPVRPTISNISEAAGQMRRAGRLFFALNAKRYVSALDGAYSRCNSISKSKTTYIHIFTGLCGGTGSGSIIDALMLARKHYPSANIVVYAMMPERVLPRPNMDNLGRYYPNGYAALCELNAVQVGKWTPCDVEEGGQYDCFDEGRGGVANGITLYSNETDNDITFDSLTDLPQLVSDYIFARIFLIRSNDKANEAILRGYTFENITPAEMWENSETTDDLARSRKLNSFGIKRVIYPENRIQKHIIYTVGNDILNQMRFNNYDSAQGYLNIRRPNGIVNEYVNDDRMNKWCLNVEYLTLDHHIIKNNTTKALKTFDQDWRTLADIYAADAKFDAKENGTSPLTELNVHMDRAYNEYFRKTGVVNYFLSQERVIQDMVESIRQNIENDLFNDWNNSKFSIVELQDISTTILERASAIREKIEDEQGKTKMKIKECEEDIAIDKENWSNQGILGKMLNKKNDIFNGHIELLTEYYSLKTKSVAYDFALKLLPVVIKMLQDTDSSIRSFNNTICEAIDKAKNQMNDHRMRNKGLDDIKVPIIEVCENDAMLKFEHRILTQEKRMEAIAADVRTSILPHGRFTSFAELQKNLSVEQICDILESYLPSKIEEEHNQLPFDEVKVLGLNVLKQLQQKLSSPDKLRQFAADIISQSGILLSLDQRQNSINVDNNQGYTNRRSILVSLPSPDGDESLERFRDDLKRELLSQVDSGIEVQLNDSSPRKNEMSVIAISYCFPMRAIATIKAFKDKYVRFMNDKNSSIALKNALLAHCEGTGTNLPNLFAEGKVLPNTNPSTNASTNGSSALTPPSHPLTQAPPPLPTPQTEIKLFIAVNGQQYGPYDMNMCRQMVSGGQLTQQSLVWMEGLPSWTIASQVPALAGLFAPQMPPAIPGMPPVPPIQ